MEGRMAQIEELGEVDVEDGDSDDVGAEGKNVVEKTIESKLVFFDNGWIL